MSIPVPFLVALPKNIILKGPAEFENDGLHPAIFFDDVYTLGHEPPKACFWSMSQTYEGGGCFQGQQYLQKTSVVGLIPKWNRLHFTFSEQETRKHEKSGGLPLWKLLLKFFCSFNKDLSPWKSGFVLPTFKKNIFSGGNS